MKFIEDKELDLLNSTNSDLLGTKPYAETLFELIKSSPGKQNIGLFGGWGSGKSTIIKTLEGLISLYNSNNIDKQIAFFKYDAWKYSKDDFRRSFLNSLNLKFKVIEEEILNEVLYYNVSKEDTSNTEVNFNYHKIVPYVILAIIFLFIYVFFSSNFKSSEKFLMFIFSGGLSIFLGLSRDFFRVIPRTVTQSKIIEPELFEKAFKKIIHFIFNPKKGAVQKIKESFSIKESSEKIIIVIDNLDRCDKENLITTLASIKNFLENENVIFILPVDEKGITSFLNISTDDAEEYLRKIFHQIIRLKKFTPDELVEFTKEINLKYNLNLTNKGIRLICQEYTSNPRKIIQFINNLETERDLLTRQINSKYVDLDFNKKADEFLIKLLIIKQEWSELYQKLTDDFTLLNKINKAIRGKIRKKGDRFLLTIDKEDFPVNRNQKRFFKRNTDIHFKNIEPFILNIDRLKEVPDDLKEHIENAEIDEAFELMEISTEDLEKNKPNEKIKLFLNQIEKIYDIHSNKFEDYESIAPILVEVLSKIIHYPSFSLEIKDDFHSYSFINKITSNNNFVNLISNYHSFKELVILCKWLKTQTDYNVAHNKLINYFFDSTLIVADEQSNTLHYRIIKFLDIYKDDIKSASSFGVNLKKTILNRIELLIEYSDLFKNNIELSFSILDEDFIEKMIEELNKGELLDSEVISALIDITDGYLNKGLLKDKTTLTKYTNYYSQNLTRERNKNHNFSHLITHKELIDKLGVLLPKSDINKISFDINTINSIHNTLMNSYNANLKEEQIEVYKSFFKMVWGYMSISDKFCTAENISKYFNHYFSKNDILDLSIELNKIFRTVINSKPESLWVFENDILEKARRFKKLDFILSSIEMFENYDDINIKSVQAKEIIKNTITYAVHFKDQNDIISFVSKKLLELNRKSKDSYSEALKNLNSNELKEYVYLLPKLKNTKLISNSISLYLSENYNYQSFGKTIRFINENFSDKVLGEELIKLFEANRIPRNWFFLFKNLFPKSIINEIVIIYLSSYRSKHNNTAFLKNLIMLKKSELYKSTLSRILSFLEKDIASPTKTQRSKILVIKNNLKL